MPAFLELVSAEHPVGLVVGLPLTADGTEEHAARSARDMGTLVSERTRLPVEFVDERFSTARALGAIREMGGSTRGRKEDVDALAAAVLLQQFLDMRRNADR
jgi:putative Holliday junction resolvase